MGHGMVVMHACCRAYCRIQRKKPKKAWVSPNGNGVRVFNGSPAVDGQVADIVNRELNKGWALDGGGGTLGVLMAPQPWVAKC